MGEGEQLLHIVSDIISLTTLYVTDDVVLLEGRIGAIVG
jgi:hypothetical protein